MPDVRRRAKCHEAAQHKAAPARPAYSPQGPSPFCSPPPSSRTNSNAPHQRFEHSKSTPTKLSTRISFPLTLDLYPYTTAFRSSSPAPSKTATPPNTSHNTNAPANVLIYELSSVVVHKGKIDSGHYISYSREGDDWFMFDDSKVVLASEKEVLGVEAYLLFYTVQCLEV